MRLRNQVLLAAAAPLAGGMLAALIAGLIAVSISSQAAVGVIGNASLEEEVAQMFRSAVSKASLLNTSFKEATAAVKLFGDFLSHLLSPNDSVLVLRESAKQLPSWCGVPTVQPETPPFFLFHSSRGREESFNASCWYKHGVLLPKNISGELLQWLNQTAVADLPTRAVVQGDPEGFLNMYVGWEDTGAFRMFPFRRLDNYVTSSFKCLRYNPPIQQVGYDPRCRSWYQGAWQAQALSLPRPFVGASGGYLMSSPAVPVFVNGKAVAVAALGYLVESLARAVSDTKITPHGYAYVIDWVGKLVLHPNLTAGSSSLSLTVAEFGDATAEWQTFERTVLASMRRGDLGNATFFKSQGNEWFMSFCPIPSAQYTLAVLAPRLDAMETANAIMDTVMSAVGIQLGVFAVIAIIVGVGMVVLTSRVAKWTVGPFVRLAAVSRKLEANEEFELDEFVSVSPEVDRVILIYQGMLAALMLGNRSFYQGRHEEALRSFQRCLAVFSAVENQHGVAVCCNNIGSVLLEQESKFTDYAREQRHGEAEAYLRRSVLLAREELAKDLGEPMKKRQQHALATRLGNLAVYHLVDASHTSNPQDRGTCLVEASACLNEGLQLASLLRDPILYATLAANLAEEMSQHGFLDNAKAVMTLARDVFHIPFQPPVLSDPGQGLAVDCSDITGGSIEDTTGAVQHIALAMAHLCAKKESSEEQKNALRWATLSIETGTCTNRALQCAAVKFLSDHLREMGHLSSSMEIAELLVHKRTRCHFTFLVDVSMSMKGNRIEAAKRNLKNFLTNRVVSGDSVDIIKFAGQPSCVLDSFIVKGAEDDIRLTYTVALEQCMLEWTGTALYDAMREAYIDGMMRQGTRWANLPQPGLPEPEALSTPPSTPPGLPEPEALSTPPSTPQRWIVLLTDGGDNVSKKACYFDILRLVEEKHDVGLIIISLFVGKEMNDKLLEWVQKSDRGLLVPVAGEETTDMSGLDQAFAKAAEYIATSHLSIESL